MSPNKATKKVTLTSQGPAVAAVALDFVVEVQSNITKRKKEKKGTLPNQGPLLYHCRHRQQQLLLFRLLL